MLKTTPDKKQSKGNEAQVFLQKVKEEIQSMMADRDNCVNILKKFYDTESPDLQKIEEIFYHTFTEKVVSLIRQKSKESGLEIQLVLGEKEIEVIGKKPEKPKTPKPEIQSFHLHDKIGRIDFVCLNEIPGAEPIEIHNFSPESMESSFTIKPKNPLR